MPAPPHSRASPPRWQSERTPAPRPPGAGPACASGAYTPSVGTRRSWPPTAGWSRHLPAWRGTSVCSHPGFVEHVQVRRGEQLHAHRGHLRKFDGRVAVVDELLLARGQLVEGVAAFVEHGAHVVVAADGVGEDEWPAPLVQGALVASRGLALAAVQIQESLLPHEAELITQGGIDPAEDLFDARNQVVDAGKGPQRGAAPGVDQGIPRPERVHAKLPAAFFENGPNQGNGGALPARMELPAVLGRAVKPPAPLESVVAVGWEAGIAGG